MKVERCVRFVRVYEELTYPQIHDAIKAGDYIVHHHEWDADPDWKDKARLRQWSIS